CQAVVNAALYPVRIQSIDAIIYHYMDCILIATPLDSDFKRVITQVYKAIKQVGLHISPDKVQETSAWKYLGWQITKQEIRPQPLCIKLKDTVTLNELQKILGAINWLRSVLGLTTEELHPLFILLKGNPDPLSSRTLTNEAKKALSIVSQAIENRQGWRRLLELPIMLAI
ncbi:hypothetical protein N324_03706, partial [Chlamydotis macqueenii]